MWFIVVLENAVRTVLRDKPRDLSNTPKVPWISSQLGKHANTRGQDKSLAMLLGEDAQVFRVLEEKSSQLQLFAN